LSFIDPQWTTKAIEKTLSNQKSGQKSVLTALLRASDPESGAKLTLPETIALSTGFMLINPDIWTDGSIAAADTTAVSLTFTIYHCLANPRVWQKLRDEIRSKFNTAEEITGQSTSSLEYLEAVIHEGRLRSSILM
jgi:cytochrome P450